MIINIKIFFYIFYKRERERERERRVPSNLASLLVLMALCNLVGQPMPIIAYHHASADRAWPAL